MLPVMHVEVEDQADGRAFQGTLDMKITFVRSIYAQLPDALK